MANELKLSVIDQAVIRCFIRSIVCFPFPDPSRIPEAGASIRAAIEATFRQWPFLAGDVVKATDVVQSGRLVIKHHTRDTFPWTYQELSAQGMPPSKLDGEVLCSQPHRPNYDDPDSKVPATTLQVNFIEGGMLLGFCLNHSVMDGVGAGQLYRKFAKNLHLENKNFVEDDMTVRNRDVVRSLIPQSKGPFLCPEIDTSFQPILGSVGAGLPKPIGRVFIFSGLRLRMLKKVLMEFVPFLPEPTSMINPMAPDKEQTDPDPEALQSRFISISDILTALVWAYVTRARMSHLTQDQQTRMAIACNVRPKVDPPLPYDYPGNTTLCTMAELPVSHFTPPKDSLPSFSLDGVTTTANELQTWAQTALTIRTVTSALDATTIPDRVGLYASLPDVRGVLPAFNGKCGSAVFLTFGLISVLMWNAIYLAVLARRQTGFTSHDQTMMALALSFRGRE